MSSKFFECKKCGTCCRNLLLDFHGITTGMFLTPKETALFDKGLISPYQACMHAVHREKISETVPFKVQLSVKNCLKRIAGNQGVSAWVRQVIIEKLRRLVEGEPQ